MLIFLAFMAAIGCAVFNGVAVIFEKIGASKEPLATSPHPSLLWRLRGNTSYLAGIVLDLLAWLLTLYAVHSLPLFIVQPIIACSVIVTILAEHFLFRRKLTLKFTLSLMAVVIGLILLASVATPDRAITISNSVKLMIILTPIILLILGFAFTKLKNNHATFILAAISGI